MRLTLIILLLLTVLGCSTVYKQSPTMAVAPDSFSAFTTVADDGEWTGGFFGLNWNLK